MTEVKEVETSFADEAKLVLTLAARGKTAWLLPSNSNKKKVDHLLEGKNITVIISGGDDFIFNKIAEEEFMYIVDHGQKKKYFMLPSGLVVKRKAIGYSSDKIQLKDGGKRYNINSADKVLETNAIIVKDEEKNRVMGMTDKQLAMWKKGLELINNKAQWTMLFAIIMTWEDAIFTSDAPPKWLDKENESDITNLSNLALQLFVNISEYRKWAKDNNLNPDKVTEIVKFYRKLLKALPGENEQTTWTFPDFDMLFRELTDNKTITSLTDTTFLSKSPLHYYTKLRKGDKVIPLISSTINKLTIIFIYISL